MKASRLAIFLSLFDLSGVLHLEAEEEVEIETVVVDPGTIAARLRVRATSRAGPIHGFVLPIRFDPARLQLVDFRPSGTWVLDSSPGLVESVGTSANPGIPGEAALAVVVPSSANPSAGVPQSADGALHEIAVVECMVLTPPGMGPLCDSVDFVEGRVRFGLGPTLLTSLVIGGEDYYRSDPNHRLLTRAGALGVAERLGLDITQPVTTSTCHKVLREIQVGEGTNELFVILRKHSAWNGTLEVLRNGSLVKSRTGPVDFVIHLESPPPGRYTLVLSGPVGGTGLLSAMTTLPQLPFGEWSPSVVLRQNGSAWYQFDVPSGLKAVHVSARGVGPLNRLVLHYQSLEVGQRAWAQGANLEAVLNNPFPGRYYVEYSESGASFGSTLPHVIRVDLQSPPQPPDQPAFVAAISPTAGGIDAPVTVIITGWSFRDGAVVFLRRDGHEDLHARSVRLDDTHTKLSAVFQFNRTQIGQWKLFVTNPGEEPKEAPVPFMVEEQTEARLSVEILGRSVVRAGQQQTFTVVYGNRGNVDLPAPLLTFAISPSVPVRRTPGSPAQDPPLRIFAVSHTGPADRLRPGYSTVASLTVDIPLSAAGALTCELGGIGASARPFDWESLARHVPLGSTSQDWEATVSRARRQIGDSWDDVMKALRDVAGQPGQNPVALSNFDDLLVFVVAVYGWGSERPDPDGIGAGIDDFDVHVIAVGDVNPQPSRTYVVTHGWGGTETGDQFHQLAAEIKRSHPDANVYRVDWSDGARRFLPGSAAANINLAGDQASAILEELGINPAQTTLIGESFGNYVNHRVAMNLGAVDRILAFNPANELGGYHPPNLREFSNEAWSFHTYSIADTQADIADHRLFLETPEGAGTKEQHTYGIEWLRQRLEEGDSSWLLFDKDLATLPAGFFDGKATLDGGYIISPFAHRFDPLFADVVPPAETLSVLLLLAVRAISPEDKYGPTGYDHMDTPPGKLKRYVPGEVAFTYKVDFWNHEDATASTQEVIIEDQLDANLDWGTVRFEEFGFLQWRVPLEGGQYFNIDVSDIVPLDEDGDGRPDIVGGKELRLLVNVEGTFDAETGFVRWRFRSLNPLTRQPPEDPLAGFLPPITDGGEEIGWVTYSVSPRRSLESGTAITNVAFVKFDVEPFRPAPACDPEASHPQPCPYLNTIDSGIPESSVRPLEETQTSTSFLVEWEGSDEDAGSDIRSYEIWVSENGSEPVRWIAAATAQYAVYEGVPGHRYCFYSLAIDNVGHQEARPADFDACTEAPSARFRRGNANDDGGTNLTDAIFIFNFLFLGGRTPPCMDAADTNDQGTVNLTSGIYLLNFLFLGGRPPPSPYFDCGTEGTTDELDCMFFSSCR